MRAVEQLRGDVRELRTHVDTRLDGVAQAAVPAAAYVERNRATEQSIAQLLAAITAEQTARQAGDAALHQRIDADNARRDTWQRFLFGGVVVAIGSSAVELLRGTGVAG